MLGGGTDGGELFCFVQFCRVQVGGLVLQHAGGALTHVQSREAVHLNCSHMPRPAGSCSLQPSPAACKPALLCFTCCCRWPLWCKKARPERCLFSFIPQPSFAILLHCAACRMRLRCTRQCMGTRSPPLRAAAGSSAHSRCACRCKLTAVAAALGRARQPCVHRKQAAWVHSISWIRACLLAHFAGQRIYYFQSYICQISTYSVEPAFLLHLRLSAGAAALRRAGGGTAAGAQAVVFSIPSLPCVLPCPVLC